MHCIQAPRHLASQSPVPTEIHAKTRAETAAPATMQIFMKDPAGKTVTIDDVVPSDTIATVLDQFERKTQMRARTNMRYVY